MKVRGVPVGLVEPAGAGRPGASPGRLPRPRLCCRQRFCPRQGSCPSPAATWERLIHVRWEPPAAQIGEWQTSQKVSRGRPGERQGGLGQ